MTYIPESPETYNKKQIIINSGRVLLNAQDDSILLFANKSIGLSTTGTVNIDSDKGIILNAPKIQLGLKASEPLLLGNKTSQWLTDLISKIDSLSIALSVMVSLPDGSPYANVNSAASQLSITIKELNSSIDSLKSKQNYTL